MIREFLLPETLQEALAMKEQHGDQAVYMASGARLNAAPTKTEKAIVISLSRLGLQSIKPSGVGLEGGWEIGAMTTLQQVIDHPELPEGLREAAGLIFSRNMRNQITLGGEIAANLQACQIVPALLAMDAEVDVVSDSEESCRMMVEAWQQRPYGLITNVIVPTTLGWCRSEKVGKSCAGLPIVSVSLAVNIKDGKQQFGIALAGVADKAIRLHDVEALITGQALQDREAIEEAVAKSVFPETDFLGSADYKRHLSSVLVGLLVAEFQEFNGRSN
ncbi:FAD binding domain-containing protein [Endozoicomonas sp.]|uniref:FAD binding domain-containing protein n=1 Tax=Endozoicomonas sp. TaxID=1892382 RepID=UPI003839D539